MKRIALLLIFTACHSTDPVPAPARAAGASMVLALVTEGVPEAVYALDLPADGSAPEYPPFVQRPNQQLYAIEYACPLEVMGLRAGEQAFRSSPAEKAQLPPFLKAQKTSVDSPAWQDVDAADEQLQASLRRIDLPDDHVCKLYGATFETVPIGVQSGPYPRAGSALPLPGGNVLLSANDDFFLIEPTGGNDPVEIETILPGGTSTSTPDDAGFIDENGVIWLLDNDGRTARGRFGETFEIQPFGYAEQAERRGIDGIGEPLEIWSAGQDLGSGRPEFVYVDYFDGLAWSRQGATRFSFLTPRVVRVDRGVALFSGLDFRGYLYRVRARTGTTALASREEFGPIPPQYSGLQEITTSLTSIPGYGIVAGNAFAEGTSIFDVRVEASMLVRWDGTKWIRMPETTNDLAITFTGRLADGVLVYGGRNRVLERTSIAIAHHPKAGICLRAQVRDETILRALPLGSGHALLIPDNAGNMTMLRRTGTKKDHPCL